MGEFEGTPGPWEARHDGHGAFTIENEAGKQVCFVRNEVDARKVASAPELLEALQAYVQASEMPTYGDASDFVWPKIEMREPGNTAWGWICEKHGLGYQSGCICCCDDFDAHMDRKNQSARYARNYALRDAHAKARAAIAKATGD